MDVCQCPVALPIMLPPQNIATTSRANRKPFTATFFPDSFIFRVPSARQWLTQRQQPMHSSDMTRSFCITGMYDGQTWVQTPHATQVFLSRVTFTGESME